ncbi:MAG: M3 family metallopeptidase, partial [Candidatus Woesearchaeota archaeon]
MVTWDLEQIYPFKDTEKLISELKRKADDFVKYRDELDPKMSAERFMDLLREFEKMSVLSNKLNAYASLSLSEDTSDSEKNMHVARISELDSDISNKLMFFDLWFKSLSDKDAKRYIDNAGKYSYFLKKIRQFKKFTLSEKEEKIINIKDLTGSEVLVRLYDLVANKFKYRWGKKEITQSELTKHVKSSKEEERKKAYDLLLGRYKEHEALLGELYKNIILDWKNENIKLRGFEKPISPRNLSNDVDDKTVDALLDVTRKNIRIYHEYFRLKAKLIKKKKLERYDIYAPATKSAKKYNYQESKKIVLDAYRSFSDQAYEYAKEIFDKNHVHSELKAGKQGGAFCSSVTKDMPPYILLNFTGVLNDVFTMMHEFGHGIHSRAARNQTQFTFHSSLPMAETASIFGETLLGYKLLSESEKIEKIALLVNSLDSHYASIIRQAYFVIFEKDAHDLIAKGCTVDDLNKLYYDNLKEQFGSSINVPKIFSHEWKYI